MIDEALNIDLINGTKLPLMELFYSIQGEGFNTGEAAVFVRIGGCDVGCKWCDVKESWNPNTHPLTDTQNICDQVFSFNAQSVVVTGGEPLLYNMSLLCKLLHEKNTKLFLETSGSQLLSGDWDWICVSPKKQNPPLKEILTMAHELKVIISDESDFSWAEENLKLVSPNCYVCLQPEWSRKDKMTPLIINYVMQHPTWKLSLQTHKYLNIP